MNKILIVNKEKDVSSNKKLMEIKNQYKIKKCGFVGTLDPFATGLLIVCCGSYTKLVDYFHSFTKTYVAKIKFGSSTDTLDLTGNIIYNDDFIINEEKLLGVLKIFSTYDQIPPQFSAKKVNGKRAYEFARENIEVVLKSKRVTIYKSTLLELNTNNNTATIEFEVSSGTYIRSLANDIAAKMNTKAYLEELHRTKVGPISLKTKNIDLNNIFDLQNISLNNKFEVKLVKNGQLPKNITNEMLKKDLINIKFENNDIALYNNNRKLILLYEN